MPLSQVQAGHDRWQYVPSQPMPCFSGIRPKRGLELESCDDVTGMEANVLHQQQQTHLPAKRVCIRDLSCEQSDYDMNENLPGCLKDFPPSPSPLSPHTHSRSSPSSTNGTNRTNVTATSASLSSSSSPLPAAPPSYLPSMVAGYYHNNYNHSNNNHNICQNATSSNGVLSSSPSLPPITEDKSIDNNLNHSDSNNNNNDNDDLMMEDDDDNDHSRSALSPFTSVNNDNYAAATTTTTRDPAAATGYKADNLSQASMDTQDGSSSPKTTASVYCGYSSCRGLKPSPVSGRSFCHCYASWRGMYGMEGAYFNDYY